jgi:PIN domain
MFNVLIDTCVWLDIAQDSKQSPLIDSIIAMQTDGHLKLLVPRIVLVEFQRNRLQVAERAQRSLSSHFNLVKDAVRKADGDSKRREQILEYLSNLDHRIPLAGAAAVASGLERIEGLLNAAVPIEEGDDIKVRAADRALRRQAPCHHQNKNAIADAILIEIYFDCVRVGSAGDRFAFVTHNKHDFSDMGTNQKVPHPDLSNGFSRVKSLYFVTLADCLRRIDPELVQDVIWEGNYAEEVRSLSDILEALDRLTTQVWYNRHKNREWSIKRGKIKLITRAEWDAKSQKGKKYLPSDIIDTIWAGALQAAKSAERQLGKGNYGPWSDFEWGMINGKLSALRWALGDEWDMLDT